MKYPLARAEEAKKVIKISGGGARPLGGPRLLGPFDPSIIRRKGKKKNKKKPKKVIKISGGGARPLGGPRSLGPFVPLIIRYFFNSMVLQVWDLKNSFLTFFNI